MAPTAAMLILCHHTKSDPNPQSAPTRVFQIQTLLPWRRRFGTDKQGGGGGGDDLSRICKYKSHSAEEAITDPSSSSSSSFSSSKAASAPGKWRFEEVLELGSW